MTITAAQFKAATGNDPKDDDLERCNCSIHGVGHIMCGWCADCNGPFYACGGKHPGPNPAPGYRSWSRP